MAVPSMSSATYQTRRRQSLGIPDGIPLCAECNATHDRHGQRLCHLCHAAYQRRWRAEQARMAREYRRLFHVKHVSGETK